MIADILSQHCINLSCEYRKPQNVIQRMLSTHLLTTSMYYLLRVNIIAVFYFTITRESQWSFPFQIRSTAKQRACYLSGWRWDLAWLKKPRRKFILLRSFTLFFSALIKSSTPANNWSLFFFNVKILSFHQGTQK